MPAFTPPPVFIAHPITPASHASIAHVFAAGFYANPHFRLAHHAAFTEACYTAEMAALLPYRLARADMRWTALALADSPSTVVAVARWKLVNVAPAGMAGEWWSSVPGEDLSFNPGVAPAPSGVKDVEDPELDRWEADIQAKYAHLPRLDLNHIATDPAYARRGAAGILMAQGLEIADAHGLASLIGASAVAERLYAGFGYVVVGRYVQDLGIYEEARRGEKYVHTYMLRMSGGKGE